MRMESVKVKKSELLAKLEENRAAHRAVFEEALEGYREAVIKELEVMLTDARKGKLIRRTVNLVEPMDQTKDYDRAIAMLKMSQDEIISINESDFACYVLDNWRWRDQFIASNSSYLKNK